MFMHCSVALQAGSSVIQSFAMNDFMETAQLRGINVYLTEGSGGGVESGILFNNCVIVITSPRPVLGLRRVSLRTYGWLG